jgi:hypothetical protein
MQDNMNFQGEEKTFFLNIVSSNSIVPPSNFAFKKHNIISSIYEGR